MQSDLLLENPPAASKSKGSATGTPVPKDDLPTNGSRVIEVKTPAPNTVTEHVVPMVPEQVVSVLALPGPKEPTVGESEDFDWADPESIIIPSQPAVAVYFNPRGEVVIRQESQYHPDEDHFVYVGRKNLRPLIERLQQIDRG
jgi:hypothetical protein